MIRIQGDMESAKKIEDLIKNGTLFMSVPFGVRLYHLGIEGKDVQGKDSNFYTRRYEIIGDKEAAMKAERSYGGRFVATLRWLMLHNITVDFRWDYRTKQAEIKVSPDDWRRLTMIIPDLKGRVQIIEPNRCRIVEYTKKVSETT